MDVVNNVVCRAFGIVTDCHPKREYSAVPADEVQSSPGVNPSQGEEISAEP